MKKTKRVTISVKIDTDLEFRKIASTKFFFKSGWYSKAIDEAMNLWIDNEIANGFNGESYDIKK
ncbi:hypothetical protein [Methanobrevibacter sp. DSM 116169]|uniref:hypothetical protein n=1 Tax=Methanobrevibacter sp. DSM 116169 TaxID=3242727 RepID=UPI0038FBEDD2